jgi:hypothetical protein
VKTKNVHPLFDHVHTLTLDENAAVAFSKKAGAAVKAGDELRMYLDKDGLPAQAIISRDSGEGAVAYNEKDGFLWGALLEAGEKSFLIGDSNPCVMVDLSNLAFWYQEHN